MSTFNAIDLCLGRVSNLAISFTLDADNLGVGKNVVSFNIVGSKP